MQRSMIIHRCMYICVAVGLQRYNFFIILAMFNFIVFLPIDLPHSRCDVIGLPQNNRSSTVTWLKSSQILTFFFRFPPTFSRLHINRNYTIHHLKSSHSIRDKNWHCLKISKLSMITRRQLPMFTELRAIGRSSS